MRNRWIKALFAMTAPIANRLAGESDFPPVFIVGNIRSGTTLVYQYLTGAFDSCYFSNLERYYYRTPLSSAYFFRAAQKYSFTDKSIFGEISGVYAPSDGWEIFNRYFSYYFNPGTQKSLLPLKKVIRQTSYIYHRPFFNKNNANSLRVFELNDLFGDALFISVRRSPVANICSVLKGRQENHIPAGQNWAVGPGILPVNWLQLTELEQACFQYHIVNGFLERFAATISPQRFIQVDYEAFCHAPGELLREVQQWYPSLELRGLESLPQQFEPSVEAGDPALTAAINEALSSTSAASADWVNSTIQNYYSHRNHGV